MRHIQATVTSRAVVVSMILRVADDFVHTLRLPRVLRVFLNPNILVSNR